MAGCYGSSSEDRYFERQLDKYLDSQDDHEEDDTDDEDVYIVVRHIMFYPKTDEVTMEQLKRFFTDEAIESFIKYGYLKKIKTC
jgi:hypothetical protein